MNIVLKDLIFYIIIVTGLMIAGVNAEEWEKVNINGFGDIDNKSSYPMVVFRDNLYLGTWNDAGTEIWVTSDGTNSDWHQVNINGFGVPENSHSISMEVFDDKLYVGVFNDGGGEVWFTGDGTYWDQVKITDFSLNNSSVRAMSTFASYGSNQHLYIGTDNEEGTQTWMTSNGMDWLLIEEKGFDDANNTSAYCMGVFNNYLYLGTANQQSGTQIWRTQGGITWVKANTSGFGYSSNLASYSMCTFKNYLYAGTVNHLTGTQVWRTTDGSNWYQSNIDGFGDPENSCSYCMTVFKDCLYLGTGNAVARVWRTDDGVIWEQVNDDGFGDNDNKRIHSLIVFDGYLYAGTGNRKGTEIWRCKVSGGDYNPCFLEMVFKNEPQKLDALRMMRDKMLSNSMGGSDFIELYYRYSSEIIDICNAYLELKEKTLEILKRLIPGVILLSEGRRKNLSTSMTRELLSLSEEYAKVGSPGLQLAVRKIKMELKSGNLSTLLRPAEMEMVEKSTK
jgi:hypothetical protein